MDIKRVEEEIIKTIKAGVPGIPVYDFDEINFKLPAITVNYGGIDSVQRSTFTSDWVTYHWDIVYYRDLAEGTRGAKAFKQLKGETNKIMDALRLNPDLSGLAMNTAILEGGIEVAEAKNRLSTMVHPLRFQVTVSKIRG